MTIAVYALEKIVTTWDSENGWDPDSALCVYEKDDYIEAATEEEAIAEIRRIHFLDCDLELQEDGTYIGSQFEDEEGNEDENGKYLADYTIHITLYEKKTSSPPDSESSGYMCTPMNTKYNINEDVRTYDKTEAQTMEAAAILCARDVASINKNDDESIKIKVIEYYRKTRKIKVNGNFEIENIEPDVTGYICNKNESGEFRYYSCSEAKTADHAAILYAKAFDIDTSSFTVNVRLCHRTRPLPVIMHRLEESDILMGEPMQIKIRHWLESNYVIETGE